MHISHWIQLELLKCYIVVTTHKTRYCVRLMDDQGRCVATDYSPKNGSVDANEALRKIIDNAWGPISSMYGVTARFVELAQKLFGAKELT